MRYDFIEAFSDIKDKYIADAMPMAQKPVELRPEPRSRSYAWRKLAAAAACLAVLVGAGGVFALKAANPAQTSSPLDSVSFFASDEVQSNLPWVDLDTFYNSTQGISKYLSHNDSMIFDNDDELVKFKIVSSKKTDEMRFFIGIYQDEYGLGDEATVVAALENTSDKVIGVFTPFSRDDKNGCYYNLSGTHSEIAVDLKNGDWNLRENTEKEFFLDDPHILAIKPGETYYQAMDFETTYKTLSGEYADVPAGTYNGTASVNLVLDTKDISVHSLDFNVNIADWRACRDWFANNGLIEDAECDSNVLYKKDGIYAYDDDETLTKLYGGEYVQDWYKYDINGDGVSEMLSTVTVNSEIGDLIYAYDWANEQLYVSDRFDKYNFRLDRVNGRPMVRKFGISGTEISVEPLAFDMFTPCVIGKNGEPIPVAIDPDGGTVGEVPMAPSGSDPTFGGYDDDSGFFN